MNAFIEECKHPTKLNSIQGAPSRGAFFHEATMPYATQPNVSLTTAWTAVVTGSADVFIQNLGSDTVFVSIGSSAPAQGAIDGNQIPRNGNWSFTGMTSETVYARAGSTSGSIAVTKG